ncbi:MAG: hypothetical protein ACO2PO_20285 [Candidatus Calescibacterium sp.]
MNGEQLEYKAYRPRPFTKEEKSYVTLLFGGLTFKHEKLLQGALENMGYKAKPLPDIKREDLDIGKEFIDVGACCPTIFVSGNIARTLMQIERDEGRQALINNYIYVTMGACGPCRFGQYHESYERVLEALNLKDFRMFLLGQLKLSQSVNGGGLEVGVPLSLGLLFGVFIGDLITDMEYATRPYEVKKGQVDKIVNESIELLYQKFKSRPIVGKKIKNFVWHIFTNYFVDALKEVKKLWDEIEVDRLQPKPKVKITGEFWLQTHEGDGNYNIKRWLEGEGAEVIPPPIAVWFDYLLHKRLFKLEDSKPFVKNYYIKKALLSFLIWLYKRTYNKLRKALNNIPNPLPDQKEIKELARPYFYYGLGGGEGHMLIGKALYALKHKKAHMICELSPYGCLPNTMSQGAMAKVLADYPELLYAPIEIKGDSEVHAYSRCQMILTEAKKRAKEEFEQVLEKARVSIEEIREFEEKHPELKKATYKVPHYGYVGTAANYVYHVAKLMGKVK